MFSRNIDFRLLCQNPEPQNLQSLYTNDNRAFLAHNDRSECILAKS
jgi:hypothetical protein